MNTTNLAWLAMSIDERRAALTKIAETSILIWVARWAQMKFQKGDEI